LLNGASTHKPKVQLKIIYKYFITYFYKFSKALDYMSMNICSIQYNMNTHPIENKNNINTSILHS